MDCCAGFRLELHVLSIVAVVKMQVKCHTECVLVRCDASP